MYKCIIVQRIKRRMWFLNSAFQNVFLRLFHLMNVLLKMLNGCYILNIVHILLAETVDTCSVVAHTILLVIIYNSLNSIKDNQIQLI